MQYLIAQVVGCLLDSQLPVKVAAVVALRSFIEEIEDVDSIKHILPQLLRSIFNIMDQVGVASATSVLLQSRSPV